jgi:hypothetical protein
VSCHGISEVQRKYISGISEKLKGVSHLRCNRRALSDRRNSRDLKIVAYYVASW